jgi:hypothetical protein
MAADGPAVNFWSLTSTQLAERLGSIANAAPSEVDPDTRAEAGHLVDEWRDTLNLPKKSFEEQQRRVGLLDSLQKRSIEILVRVSRGA